MLTTTQKIAFLNDGFLLVPNVFSSSEVTQLRGTLKEMFRTRASHPGDFDGRATLGSVRFDPFCREPTLAWVLGHGAMVSALKALLGEDFLYLPEMSAHCGGFGDWHKDTTQQEKAGHFFQWSPTYATVEAAIYLQDNGDWGGGLDVIPGSHRASDRWVAERGAVEELRARLERRRLIPRLRGRSIPSKAGDLVIFDFRLDHKASWPRRSGEIPGGRAKFALFAACSANNEHAQSYLRYIKQRPDYAFLKEHEYSPSVREAVSSAGARLLPVS
ncbi:MAG: phytanoyl-CoA dioxygenase family protein [Archangium sp.]|nr:phytanoyl-CoA dioxygenase family protein [Archangium sp.]MDP3575844.1 phytanoyl-CoA dioxygenase family protein [Archangium sp.]